MSSRLWPPVKASRKSCKIPVCFGAEVSESPAVAPRPLKKRKRFHVVKQCASNRGGSTSSIGRWDAAGTRELARMLTALPWLPAPHGELRQLTWPRSEGSVALWPGRVIPGGTELVVLDTVAVDGYFKLLKLSSGRSRIGLGSLAQTSAKKKQRGSLEDT